MQTTVKDMINQFEKLIEELKKQYECNIVKNVTAINYKTTGWTITVHTQE